MARSNLQAAALLALLCSIPASGQTLAASSTLPDSPGSLLQATAARTDPPQGTAQLHGTVLDVHGAPVPEATVALVGIGKLDELKVTASDDGTFVFSNVPTGYFHLFITATGLDPYTSSEFYIKAGTNYEAPTTALKISTSTTVNVSASSEQIAQAQIQEQEKQRVFGIFPNFYTSYIWDAAPLTSKQKYSLATRTLIDPVDFILVGVSAGIFQANNTYPAYGQGAQGYAKRYGAIMADNVSARYFSSAIFPSIFHQDPRYFYQGTGGFRSRTRHAIGSTFVTRGDNGKAEPNYSRLFGSLAAGGLSNAYHPAPDRGAGLTFQNFGLSLLGNAADNFIREFVLRKLVPSVPQYANGKQQPSSQP